MELEPEKDLPLEYNLFALAFKTPGAIGHFTQTLPTEDVGLVDGNAGLNQFYMALCDFYDKTGCDPIDPVAFKSWLAVETDIEAALGGSDGVDAFMQVINNVELSTPEAVSGVLRNRANRKRQFQYVEELQVLLAKKDQTAAEKTRVKLLSTMINVIMDETGQDPLSSVFTGSDLAALADSLWDLPDFLPTQYPALNKALGYTEKGGIVKGAVTGILAPSGQGKSTFAKDLTRFWLEQGYSVLYINYEEVASHWNRILMTQITGKNVYLGEEMDPLEKRQATELFREKMLSWGDRIMVQHDPETAYFEDLEQWLRSLVNKTDTAPDAIVIDTIQSMFLKSAAGKPRWGQFEEMMVRLEKLAKDLGSATVITAQENTNRMKEKRDVVMQSDTGGSIAIVQKCTVTIHLVGVKNNSDISEDESIVEIQIPKNRITGTSFSHNPPKLRYDDATKSFYPYDLEDDPAYHEGQYMDDFDVVGY